MRGQWLSTTRKLNRHYQSGQGGTHWTLLSGLRTAICGFEYGNSSPTYPQIYLDKAFEKYDTRNVIVAPLYKLFNSLPTTYTQETDIKIQYGLITSDSNGAIGIDTNSSFHISTITPVWRYGEFRGDPYWAYKKYSNQPTEGYIYWSIGTWDDQNMNQNGIYVSGYNPEYAEYSTAPPSGARLGKFETEYAGRDVDVVIPVYEVLAVMDPGVSPIQATGAIITDDPLGTRFPNEIKLKDFARGAQPVSGPVTWANNLPDIIINIPNDGLYRYRLRGRPHGDDSSGELGTLGVRDSFIGDVGLVFMADTSVSPATYISAGRYVDPGSGIPINMVYTLRLKYLEHQVIQPATRVLSQLID